MINKQITEILKKEGILSKEAFHEFKDFEKLHLGNVLDFCTDRGIASASKLIPFLQNNHALQVVDLARLDIDLEVAKKLPAQVCFEHMLIPFHEDENYIYVAMSQPDNIELIDYIERKLGKPVAKYLAKYNDIKSALEAAFNNSVEASQNHIENLISRALKVNHTPEIMAQEAPIISLLNQLILFGIRSEASDLHIEPREESVAVRYRIDGLLHDLFTLPKELLVPLIARVKILSKLKIDEHQRPLDGRFGFKEGNCNIAVRLSIVPTLHGQKTSLRFLDTHNENLSLDYLGLSNSHKRQLEEALGFSSGMILVTGPTGSGKTTTLYSLVKAITRNKVNISTIEDPIEYHLQGANQIQVNPQVNLDFVTGLKSILRQDPDIIMVGEIRDQETARIAINAALTGHLVLSSLHTNSAAAAIPRLIDMGIEPFLIASTLRTIIGQRLVRKVCPHCKQEKNTNSIPQELVKKYTNETRAVITKGAGCSQCLQTGYIGRSGIFEILPVSNKIHDLIMQRANSSMIEKEAKNSGMRSLYEDGIKRVLNKETSLEELTRVIK